MAIKLQGSSGNNADVTASGQILTKMQTTATEAGAVYLVGKADAASSSITGTITGSTQGLLGAGRVVLEQEENFVAASLNTSKWKVQTSTMTVVINANTAVMNNGASTASGAYAILQSYRSIRCYRGNDRIIAWRVALDAAPVLNNVVEIGGGICATTAAPTVEAVFRYGADQTLKGYVISSNGLETPTANSFTMATPTAFHDYLIVVGQDEVIFEIDGIPVGSIPIPTGGTAPTASESFPAFVRIYNASNTSSAQKAIVARLVTATFGGETGMSKAIINAINGDVGYQHVTGTGTGGSTGNRTNSAAPTNIGALSNTTPGSTALDGYVLVTGPASGETDYLIFGFQVPAGTINNMARALVVHSANLDVYISSGATTAQQIQEWSIGYGATAASLATAESASTKAYRRIHLGIGVFAASAGVGTLLTLKADFPQPFSVNAGEYLALILKVPVGSTLGSPIFRVNYAVNAGWE